MYEYNLARVGELAKLSGEEREHAWRWLARQPERIRVEAVKLGLDKLRRLDKAERKDEKAIIEAFYAMLTRAARDMWWVEQAKALKRKGKVSEEEAKRILEIRAKRIKAARRAKRAKKARIIELRYYYRIKELLEDGLSWRQIAEYLRKYHQFEVSHTYLRDTWRRLELERTEAGASGL